MKIITFCLLISVLLFSCDDSDDGPNLQPGWTEELIDIAARDCASADEEFDDPQSLEQCRCIARETAQLIPLEDLLSEDGLSNDQERQLEAAIISNCDIDLTVF